MSHGDGLNAEESGKRPIFPKEKVVKPRFDGLFPEEQGAKPRKGDLFLREHYIKPRKHYMFLQEHYTKPWFDDLFPREQPAKPRFDTLFLREQPVITRNQDLFPREQVSISRVAQLFILPNQPIRGTGNFSFARANQNAARGLIPRVGTIDTGEGNLSRMRKLTGASIGPRVCDPQKHTSP